MAIRAPDGAKNYYVFELLDGRETKFSLTRVRVGQAEKSEGPGKTANLRKFCGGRRAICQMFYTSTIFDI